GLPRRNRQKRVEKAGQNASFHAGFDGSRLYGPRQLVPGVFYDGESSGPVEADWPVVEDAQRLRAAVATDLDRQSKCGIGNKALPRIRDDPERAIPGDDTWPRSEREPLRRVPARVV